MKNTLPKYLPGMLLSFMLLSGIHTALGLTLNDNLVAYYKLENANDAIGGRTLTNVGTTPFNPALIDNGGDLGASNTTKYFYRDDAYGLTYASSRSFGFWFRLTTAPSNGSGFTLVRLLFTGGSANYTDVGYRQSGGVFQIFSASTPAGVVANYTLNVGEWYYIAATHDHAGNIRRIYVNGSEICSEASWTSTYALTTRLTIGADHAFTAGSQASGIFDEFGLWSRILSPSEIITLYNSGHGVQYPFAAPTLTTPTATSVTSTGAVLGANITSNGGAILTARGTCWGTSASPTTNCVAQGGTATGVFTQARTGLPPSTPIYYRGYATNIMGTSYSADGTFTTSTPSPATVDWNNSNVQQINLTTDRSLTFANGKDGGIYTLLISQDATGGRPVIWPSNVKWTGGTAPVLTTTSNAIDVIKFVFNGTNYLEIGTHLDIR